MNWRAACFRLFVYTFSSPRHS